MTTDVPKLNRRGPSPRGNFHESKQAALQAEETERAARDQKTQKLRAMRLANAADEKATSPQQPPLEL